MARALVIVGVLLAVLGAAALVGGCDDSHDDDIVWTPLEPDPDVTYAYEARLAGQLDRSAHTLRFVSTADPANVVEVHQGISCAFQALNAPTDLTTKFYSTVKESGVQTVEWLHLSASWTFDIDKGVDITFKDKPR